MSHKHFSAAYRCAHVALACVQNMTLGGILFGWASISGTLLTGSTESGGAGLSSEYVHLMFVTGTFFSFLGPLILGLVLDTYGPRVCSLLSVLCVAFGCALFSMGDNCMHDISENGEAIALLSEPQCTHKSLFLVGTSLLAFGGPGVQTSIIHLSNLFPQWRATTTTLLTGSFQVSFFSFYAFDYLYEHYRLSYKMLFGGYAVLCLLNAVISLSLWPDSAFLLEEDERESHIAREEEEEKLLEPDASPYAYTQSPLGVQIESEATQKMARERVFVRSEELKDQPLCVQLFSGAYLRLCGFFLINAFFLNFYIGLCMDLLGFPFTALLSSSAGILWTIALLVKTHTSLVVSFLCYSLFRTLVFSLVFAYIAETLSIAYLGVLVGVLFALSGALSLLQFPLAQWGLGTCHNLGKYGDSSTGEVECDPGRWDSVNVFMLVCVSSTLLFALFDWREERERAREKREREEARQQEKERESRFNGRIVSTTLSKYGAV